MKELKLKLGGISDPIRVQLIQQNLKFTSDDVIDLQRSADAVTWLSLQKILPAGEVEKCRNRLFKQIQQHVNKHNK